MNNASKYNDIYGAKRVSLHSAHISAIEEFLSELAERCSSPLLLLVDINGQLLFVHGAEKAKELVGLASLAAGDLSASQTIARLTGEYDSYQFILREGNKFNTFITEAGEELVLFVQVPRDTPLGWARMLIQKAARQIAEIPEPPQNEDIKFDFGFDEEQITSLVSDSLDDLWIN